MSQIFARYKLGTAGTEKFLSHTEVTIDVSENKNSRVMVLASGKNVEDVISIKRQWAFNYTMLPEEREDTADNGMGVKEIRALLSSTEQIVLVAPLENGDEEFINVLMLNTLSANLLRRSPFRLWGAVSFSVVEI